MKQQLLSIIILGILTTLVASCNSDKPTSSSSENISFPIVEFTISATSDTTIFGKQGTRLFIEKESFQFSDGTLVTDSIKIQIKEFYKKSEIALANLSTESNGKLLESGGMLQITAQSKGQEIEIVANKRIVVHFPKQKDVSKEMNLFYASNNKNDSAATNWNIDTVNLLTQVARINSYGYQWISPTDSTEFDFRPKNFIDTGYFFSPLNYYMNTYPFSSATLLEINKRYGVAIDCIIDRTGKIKKAKLDAKIGKEADAEILKFVNNLPDFEPGKNNKNEPVERIGFFSIMVESTPIQKTDKEYIKSFDSKYSKYENKPIKNMNDAELNYYVFSISKLGWINCDRFTETEKTIDYIVNTSFDNHTQIKMIFKDINGVLMANNENTNYSFKNVPINKPVIIFGIKNVNGQLMTSFTETKITNKPLENLAFKETTLSELKLQLEKLN